LIGVSSIGVWLPRARLQRAAIAGAMSWLTPGLPAKGSRSLAFWDEDATTMAVAAARTALAHPGLSGSPETLDLCTLTPPFAERQNASVLHAALRLSAEVSTQECGTTPRSTLIALHRALEGDLPALVVGADRPVTPPGSPAEGRAGDGAAAVTVGMGPVAFDYLGGISRTAAMTDRFRAPAARFATEWEDRWVREVGWQGIVVDTIRTALDRAGIGPEEIDHLVLATTLPRLAQTVAEATGLTRATLASDLGESIGDTHSAHALLMLAGAVDRIAPGEKLVLASFGQGATALVFRATEHIRALDTGFSAALARGLPETCYTKLPVFTGLLPWDPGPRGRAPLMEALTTADRNAEALMSFTGSFTRETGQVHFPPAKGAGQEPWPLADRGGRVVSRTADNLAFSRSPPSCYGLIDFDGGGRLMMDFTDPDAASIKVGQPVEFVFRVKDVDATTGFRRYFWKAVASASASKAQHERTSHAERA